MYSTLIWTNDLRAALRPRRAVATRESGRRTRKDTTRSYRAPLGLINRMPRREVAAVEQA